MSTRPPGAPTLAGELVELVPFSRDYLSLLHQWVTDTSTLMLWLNRRDVVALEQYSEEVDWKLRHSTLTQLIIKERQSSTPIGTIYAYDSNLTDGFTFVTIFLVQEKTRLGYGTEASMLFIDYLFAYFPLRKIYTEVYGYNERSLHVMRAAGLRQEGCLREHRFFNGEYDDLYRFALYRRDWAEVRGRYMDAIRASSAGAPPG